MKVIWTQTALGHLTEIFQFISRDSPRYAQRTIDRITNRSKQLATFPKSGQVVIKYEDPEIRELIEGSYRVIYRTGGTSVHVLAVIHGARELPDL